VPLLRTSLLPWALAAVRAAVHGHACVFLLTWIRAVGRPTLQVAVCACAQSMLGPLPFVCAGVVLPCFAAPPKLTNSAWRGGAALAGRCSGARGPPAALGSSSDASFLTHRSCPWSTHSTDWSSSTQRRVSLPASPCRRPMNQVWLQRSAMDGCVCVSCVLATHAAL
jgi:hypothetical protein